MKIKRTPTRAEGGITPEEKAKMDIITKKWIGIAFKTGETDKAKLKDAICRLYESAGLKRPRVVIVPSPFVMAVAYGLAAGWWYAKKKLKSFRATAAATRNATFDATSAATRNATFAATFAATRNATDDATFAATVDATFDATSQIFKKNWINEMANLFSGKNKTISKLMIQCISRWRNVYQGGNMWPGFSSYAEAMRDVLGLTGLNCWEKWKSYEDASIYGGFRVMHEEFCIVSELPTVLKVNAQNRPHCDTGP